MSEYWKSTPKYWCKHCNAFVKDTPFERKQHESTAKHQGNLKRFLRGIQNDHERSEREKEKVKAEVERLNKVVGASSSAAPSTSKQPTVRKQVSTTLSVADQKKQWAQLAEMGIQVPQGFRAEMALPGEWQKMAERPMEDSVKEEALNTGVRKRKFEGQEEEEEAGETVARRGWGSTTRRYPGEEQPDLDSLLSGSVIKKEKALVGDSTEDKTHNERIITEPDSKVKTDPDSHELFLDDKEIESKSPQGIHQGNHVKGEPEEGDDLSLLAGGKGPADVPVFKKRRAKAK